MGLYPSIRAWPENSKRPSLGFWGIHLESEIILRRFTVRLNVLHIALSCTVVVVTKKKTALLEIAPVSRQSKPSSSSLLAGEQFDSLGLNGWKSQHRRIKKQRRYERLAATATSQVYLFWHRAHPWALMCSKDTGKPAWEMSITSDQKTHASESKQCVSCVGLGLEVYLQELAISQNLQHRKNIYIYIYHLFDPYHLAEAKKKSYND